MLATDTVLGGRYALGPMLGRGGVADVYQAEDLERRVPVAVKVLRNASTTDLRRFELEARTLERLDHPAIVRLRDEGEHDGVPYLVLDLVDGEPLSRVIERGPLPEDDVQRMGAALAGALAQAHDLGIVHRDVKPGNVLVAGDRSVRLTDFGIARLVDNSVITSITETGLVIGTAAYLAPEQVRGESAGPPADVYSLGLVLLEASTGARAYEGSATESAMARSNDRRTSPTLTPWLASLLRAMTAIEPARRPRAAAVADAFAHRHVTGDQTDSLAGAHRRHRGHGPAAPGAGAGRSADEGVRPRGRLLVALAAVVVAMALLLFLVGGNKSTAPPATADTSTTVTTAPPTSAAAVTTPPRTAPPKPEPPKGKGKGKTAVETSRATAATEPRRQLPDAGSSSTSASTITTTVRLYARWARVLSSIAAPGSAVRR